MDFLGMPTINDYLEETGSDSQIRLDGPKKMLIIDLLRDSHHNSLHGSSFQMREKAPIGSLKSRVWSRRQATDLLIREAQSPACEIMNRC